ncbi:hypothetical protein WG899_09225 [Paucibacter sp. AS339]|uniref:hypothetical protein n=1 Tax=Paucibacter hankyongi TaxID=3133434 RepID=UPI0030B19ED7
MSPTLARPGLLSRWVQRFHAWQRACAMPVASLYWGEAGLWSFNHEGDTIAQASGRSWPDFESWCAAHPGQQLRIWVGGAWVHNVSVPADMPLADAQAVKAYARLQFVHYFGAAAQDWPLALWQAGSGPAAGQRHAVALQEQGGLSLAALSHTARAHRVRILSLRPAWSHALAIAATLDQAWAKAECSGLALLEGRMLSWLRLSKGQLVEVQQRYLDQADGHELQTLMQGLQPDTGSSHAPKLMGWGPQGSRLEALHDSPQGAHWLAKEAVA